VKQSLTRLEGIASIGSSFGHGSFGDLMAAAI
jgi:hypothetical protein